MNFTNRFLIATGDLEGSLFDHSIIYVCRHDDEGAFGLILNKPSDTSVGSLFQSLKIQSSHTIEKSMVMIGGPVKTEQVFILHTLPTDFDATIKVAEEVGITLSRDILTAITENRAPKKMLFAFGYAGWESGQLEEEIQDNTWISIPASADIIFDTPSKTLVTEATKRFGFDINNLSDITGHA